MYVCKIRLDRESKFDRVELNSKAIRRLRELLTATQRASVGLPDKDDAGN